MTVFNVAKTLHFSEGGQFHITIVTGSRAAFHTLQVDIDDSPNFSI